MRLSELRQQRDTSGGVTTARGEGEGTVRNVVAYPAPIGALLDGHPVTIIATGDIAGMSPAEKFVDEAGRIDWAPSDEFLVDDRQVVPLSTDQHRQLSAGTPTNRAR